jgi:hypothetical protein
VPFVNVKEGFCNADGLTKPFAVMIFTDESHRYFFYFQIAIIYFKKHLGKSIIDKFQNENIKIDLSRKGTNRRFSSAARYLLYGEQVRNDFHNESHRYFFYFQIAI